MNRGADFRFAPRTSRGFTLIEVMVTVLVLSIGILGLAALQAQSLRLNHSAYLRSQATALAYDITDRMRANWMAAGTGAYDIDLGDSAPAGATVAAADLVTWKAALAVTLPNGDGSVARNADGSFTIVVSWDASRGEEDEAARFDDATQFSLTTRL